MGSRLRSLGRGAPAPRLPLLRPLLRLRGRRSLRKLLRVWPLLRRTAPRRTVRELARLAPPAGVRGYKRRRATVTLGLRRVRPVPGWALPGASCPCFFGGPAVPMLLFPILKSRSCRPTRGGNDFPSPGL